MSVTDCSFIHFVYPFLFDAGTFQERAEAISRARWLDQHFPEDDLLPHVARYLNPKSGGAAPTARLWALDEQKHNPLRLDPTQNWALLLGKEGKGEGKKIPFRFGGPGRRSFTAQLALFRSGVGFLTLHVRPHTTQWADWLDFLHYFRYTNKERIVRVQVPPRDSSDPVSPFFARSWEEAARIPDRAGPLQEVIARLLCTGALPTDPQPCRVPDPAGNLKSGEGSDSPGTWWREVFVPSQMLPFTALFMGGLPEAERAAALYRARTAIRADQDTPLTQRDRAPGTNPDHPALLPYVDNQWFTFGLDGGGFVAFDAPNTPFFTETLPAHLRDQYFLLFLIALHQRFALMGFSQAVSERWPPPDGKQDLQAFDALRGALLDFKARGCFTQVMQRENHHRCYHRWYEILQIEQLYQEVDAKVREIHDHISLKQTEELKRLAEEQQRLAEEQAEQRRQAEEARRIQLDREARAEAARDRAAQERADHLERRFNQVAFLLGIPALSLTFLQTIGPQPWHVSALTALGGFTTGAGLLALLPKIGAGQGAPLPADQRAEQPQNTDAAKGAPAATVPAPAPGTAVTNAIPTEAAPRATQEAEKQMVNRQAG